MRFEMIRFYKVIFIGLFCMCVFPSIASAGNYPSTSSEFFQTSTLPGEKILQETQIYLSRADEKASTDSKKSEDVQSDPQKTKPPTDSVKDKSGELNDKEEKREGGSADDAGGITISGNKGLVFNFDNADLTEVIRTLAELLKINYLLDSDVRGTVTIHTSGELSRKDLFPIFYQILDVNGLAAVKQDKIYKIIQAKEAARLPIISRVGRDGLVLPTEERIIIQIIPLNYVSVAEMSKVLTPFISSEGTIISKDNTNTMIVVDKTYNIKKVLRLVNVFDTDVFVRINHRFYPIQYGDVETLVGVLEKVFAAYGEAVKAGVNLIPITRLNMLLAVSPNPKIFDELTAFIEKYDVPSESTESGIYFYPVKNGQAADIADILNQVFAGKKNSKDKDRGKETTSAYRNPLSKNAKAQKAKAQTKTEQKPSVGSDVTLGSGTLRGEVNITTDESRNSLIIEATPTDYQIIKKLLTQLDIMPRQVLIEVILAEITLDESTAMGVEWSYLKGNANMSTSLLNATMGNSGLNFTIGNPERWTAALSALASENRVNILSAPSILASNSKPATIAISTEIPVASSQYRYTDNNDSLFETNIEYRDTGIMLTVTPHINESGLVTMEIDQEISEQASNVTVGNQEYPSFFKRSTTTTLTVQSGQTIVIGGLIKETTSDGASGTPWFINIPVLSFLFGKTKNEISKNELIILISPYVIATPDDVDAVTNEFIEKVGSLSLNLE